MLIKRQTEKNSSKNTDILRAATTIISCIIMIAVLVTGVVNNNMQDVVIIAPGFMGLSTAWIDRKRK